MYIKVKNEYKRLNNAKIRTNYLVCDIEGSTGQTNQEGKFLLICYKTELDGDILAVKNY